jgi:hypothetical protein
MACNPAAPIRWIQASERLVGLNAPQLADTLNRPLRDLLTALGLDPDASLNGCTFGGAVASPTFTEFRVIPEGHGAALNSGDPIDFVTGYARNNSQQSVVANVLFFPLQGNSPDSPLFRFIDGRPVLSIEVSLINHHTSLVFRPFAVGGRYPLDFFGTFHNTSGVIGTGTGKPPSPLATSISAWLRKQVGGDSSSARFTFGFADNTVVYSSLPVARIGLIGDGAGGYRYGSVNCPDGINGTANGDTDIDAGSIQPADLVAPSTNWWHTRIKIVPATPTSAAKWGVYHNGTLLQTFVNTANFPRGSQGTTHDFTRIEATIRAFDNIKGLYIHDLRVKEEEDLTL